MKKLSLLFVMLVAMAIGVKAQGHYIIPTIGFNESTQILYGPAFEWEQFNKTYRMADYVQMRAGFNAGISYRYEFKKPFLVEAGFHFNQYGYSIDDIKYNDTKIFWDRNVRFNHISVPVFFGYKFVIGQSKVFSITPKVGLQFGWYTNFKEHYMTYDAFGNEYEYNNTENFEDKFDVAEFSAVEFGWKLNSMLDIFVAITDRYSFKNMTNAKDSYSNNFNIGANVGLKIKLSK